jgi:hypothetical protein
MGPWVVAGFSDRTPYPTGSEAMGCGRKSLPGFARKASLERFSFEGLGLQFYFFQTPIRASEFNETERQFDLFVSVKGNVDAVQSRAASA